LCTTCVPTVAHSGAPLSAKRSHSPLPQLPDDGVISPSGRGRRPRAACARAHRRSLDRERAHPIDGSARSGQRAGVAALSACTVLRGVRRQGRWTSSRNGLRWPMGQTRTRAHTESPVSVRLCHQHARAPSAIAQSARAHHRAVEEREEMCGLLPLEHVHLQRRLPRPLLQPSREQVRHLAGRQVSNVATRKNPTVPRGSEWDRRQDTACNIATLRDAAGKVR